MQSDAKDFYRRTQSARKIIVVDLGFLGDSIHLLPSLWEIRRHYPNAELHTLSATIGAEALKLAPCVDRTWALARRASSWWHELALIRNLRREHFDLAFNFSGADRTIFMTALLGTRWTLGFEVGRKHFWNHWLSVDWVQRQSREMLISEQRRQFLAAGGFTLQPPRFDLAVPEEAMQWAASAVTGHPFHISISASAPFKEWPLENWIALGKMLTQKTPAVQLVATASSNPREQDRLRQLAKALDGAPLQCFEGLSIARLAALLQRCRLQIGADSGVLHLALAMGLPTVAVFRQYDGLTEWMPQGKQHRALIAPCQCADFIKEACLSSGVSPCLSTITPAEVFAQICQVVAFAERQDSGEP